MKTKRVVFDGSKWIEEIVDLHKIEKEVNDEEIEKMFVRSKEVEERLRKRKVDVNIELANKIKMYGFEV